MGSYIESVVAIDGDNLVAMVQLLGFMAGLFVVYRIIRRVTGV